MDIKDYEDAVGSCCANRNLINYIVTRNIKNYEKSKVKAVLPGEFVQLVSGEDSAEFKK